MQALTERFEMRLDQETLHAVDVWRSKQGDVPSRGEAIRRLIERGLSEAEGFRPTPGERLIIAMLCDLMKGQRTKTELNLDLIIQALLGGHYWGVQWAESGILHNHSDSPAVVNEVVNILDMYQFLENGYERLSAKDKERVKKEAHPFGDPPRFRGFDGNNEGEHMGVTSFLVEHMGKFQHFKGRGHLDSHGRTLDSYRRMLHVFEAIRPTLADAAISADQIVKVVKARTYSRDKRPSAEE